MFASCSAAEGECPRAPLNSGREEMIRVVPSCETQTVWRASLPEPVTSTAMLPPGMGSSTARQGIVLMKSPLLHDQRSRDRWKHRPDLLKHRLLEAGLPGELWHQVCFNGQDCIGDIVQIPGPPELGVQMLLKSVGSRQLEFCRVGVKFREESLPHARSRARQAAPVDYIQVMNSFMNDRHHQTVDLIGCSAWIAQDSSCSKNNGILTRSQPPERCHVLVEEDLEMTRADSVGHLS